MTFEIELITTKRRLARTHLNQMGEATTREIIDVLATGEILGYINSSGIGPRVFLLRLEDGSYRKITNYTWSRTGRVLYAASKQKVFSNEENAEAYLQGFKQVKEQALKRQICMTYFRVSG